MPLRASSVAHPCVSAVSLQSYAKKGPGAPFIVTQQPLAGPPDPGAGTAEASAASASSAAYAKFPNRGVGDVVMGSIGHAVVVAGGWCRLSSNYAAPSHLLDRLLHYKPALMEELRVVSTKGGVAPHPS
jgi:hypothetical protein